MWIRFGRIWLWLIFAIICLAGLISGFSVMAQESPIMGLLAIIASVFVAIVSVCFGMIFLDTAENIAKCADNSQRIDSALEKD